MSNSRDGHGGENGPKICSGTSHVFTLWVQDSPACPKHKNHLSSCVSSLLAAFSEARETWIRSMIQRSLFQSLVERRGVDGGGKEGPGYAEPAGGTQSFRVPNLMSQKAAFPRGVSPSVNESGDWFPNFFYQLFQATWFYNQPSACPALLLTNSLLVALLGKINPHCLPSVHSSGAQERTITG